MFSFFIRIETAINYLLRFTIGLWPEWLLLSLLVLLYGASVNQYGLINLPEEWLHLLSIKALLLADAPEVSVMHENATRMSSPLLVLVNQWFSSVFGLGLSAARTVNLWFGLISLVFTYVLAYDWSGNRRTAMLSVGILGTFGGFWVGFQGLNTALPGFALTAGLIWLGWRWFSETAHLKSDKSASPWIPAAFGLLVALLAWINGFAGFLIPVVLFIGLLWQLSAVVNRLGQFPRLFLQPNFWFSLMMGLIGIGFLCFITSPVLAQLAMKIWQTDYWVFWSHPWFKLPVSSLLLTLTLWLFPWTFFLLGPLRVLTNPVAGNRIIESDKPATRFLLGWLSGAMVLFLVNPLLVLMPLSILLARYWVNSLAEARTPRQFEWITIASLSFLLLLAVLGVRYGLQDGFNSLLGQSETLLGLPGTISFPLIKWTVSLPVWQLWLGPSLTLLSVMILLFIVMIFINGYRILAEALILLTLLFYGSINQLLSPVFSVSPGRALSTELTQVLKSRPAVDVEKGERLEIQVWQNSQHRVDAQTGQFLNHLSVPLLKQVMVYPDYNRPRKSDRLKKVYAVVDEATYFQTRLSRSRKLRRP